MEKATSAFAPAFTKPTHARVCVLLSAALLTVGSRTVSNILRTAGSLIPGHFSTYHQVFSRARLGQWWFGRILATLAVEAFCVDGIIHLAGADTVEEHRGAKVYGKGGHRDDYFFTTDLTLTAREIIEFFNVRWSRETMFQEMRAYPGLETTQERTRSTVLRAAPMLFALDSLVVLRYAQLPSRWKSIEGIQWYGKSAVTFSDMITRGHCWLWAEWVLKTLEKHHAFSKLPTDSETPSSTRSQRLPDDLILAKVELRLQCCNSFRLVECFVPCLDQAWHGIVCCQNSNA